jgi:hypothetical protein
MDGDRIDRFAQKQKIVEQTLTRQTGVPAQQPQGAKPPRPPRPPRQPWQPAVRPENNLRAPGNEYDKIPASDEFTTQKTSEYDKLPSSAEFEKSTSNPYDKLPTNAEYEATRSNGAQVKASNPYDKLPTNAEYEAMRSNGAQVKPANPYGKIPTKSEYEAMRSNGAQVKPANPYGKLPTKSEFDAHANGAQPKDAKAPQAKENPYGRMIKVDPSKYPASPISSAKSVEVETPLPFAKNARQQVQLPENGHVATGRFVLATEALLIQKNEQDKLVHYNGDHFSSDAKKLIAESVSNQKPVQVSTHKNELRVAPVQKL